MYVRNHVRRWHERRNQSSYSQLSIPPSATLEQDFDTPPSNTNETDEYDPTSTPSSSQQSVPSIKAPIVIKMQPRGKSQSPPQPLVSTRPADQTFEDEKGLDSDQITSRLVRRNSRIKSNLFFSSQKDGPVKDELTDSMPPSTTLEGNQSYSNYLFSFV